MERRPLFRRKKTEGDLKVFCTYTEKGMERKVNSFLETPGIEIIDMQFTGGFGFIGVLIRYNVKQ